MVSAANPQVFHVARSSLADTIHHRFYLAAIVLVLTAGASWGAWLLWKIGFAGSFTGISIHHVNAHGQAQIYGWVGLFIMGSAYQLLPRLWSQPLAAPAAAAVTFVLMIVGLVARTAGMTFAETWSLALPVALLGGAAQIAAVIIFSVQIYATFRRSYEHLDAYVGYLLGALFWLVVMTVTDVWHTYNTMTAATHEDLLWAIATYQAPLRDMQIHGLALFMILGISIRLLPALFDLPVISEWRAWHALWILGVAVGGEIIIFFAYRFSGIHALAALLMVPWILLAVAVAMVALPWKLWRPLPVKDRSGKFIRAAYAWLGVSLIMLLMLPVYQVISGIAFSHAYYGAIRHAITVGFISMMIMGMSARIVPMLARLDPRRLSSLVGPFMLVNAGCLLRVSGQTLTDWNSFFFGVIGFSGMLEVTGLAWWGLDLARALVRGRRAEPRDGRDSDDARPFGAALNTSRC